MSLSVLLCNVCVCYVYILKMSKKIKVKKKKLLKLPSAPVDVIDKRKLVRPLVLQLINCSRNFSSNSYLDNTQSIIITNTNL